MPKIRLLDAATINKIKAGEVIDRPASIVKELIENSLDAGATSIRVEIEGGGKKKIRILDNGHGMGPEDLVLAPLAHATSKIRTLDDIYHTDTFGFRGEALASIAHVADLMIASGGFSVSARGGEVSKLEGSVHSRGTLVEMRHLFQDMPVRQKFLKKDGTEFSYIFDVVTQFALIHPDKDFVLVNEGREELNSTGVCDQSALVILVLDRQAKGHMVSVDQDVDGILISGIVSDPTLTFPNRSRQILAVNQRVIKNPILQKAIMDGFRDLIPHQRYPLAVLNIGLPTQGLDVNIHPQKQDIKFMNPARIFEALPRAIKTALGAQYSGDFVLGTVVAESGKTHPALWAPLQGGDYRPMELLQGGRNSVSEFLHVYDTYIVLKTVDGLSILDQHAVHERILYEKIKANFGKSNHKQPLLISDVIAMNADLFHIYREEQAVFAALNFEAEEFGPNQVVVRAVPMEFADVPLSQWFIGFLEQLKQVPGSARDLTADRKEKLQMAACKAAIKAGKKMSPAEVQQLLDDFQESPSNYTCPHGRPLVITLDKMKLEQLFKRR